MLRNDQLAEWDVHVLPKPFSPSKLSELVETLTTQRAAQPE